MSGRIEAGLGPREILVLRLLASSGGCLWASDLYTQSCDELPTKACKQSTKKATVKLKRLGLIRKTRSGRGGRWKVCLTRRGAQFLLGFSEGLIS